MTLIQCMVEEEHMVNNINTHQCDDNLLLTSTSSCSPVLDMDALLLHQ